MTNLENQQTKSVDEIRTELWQAGLKYGKCCIELGLTEELAIERYIDKCATKIDKDTEIVAKCSIAFAYR